MRIAFIHEVKFDKNLNLKGSPYNLIVNTDNKEFRYFKGDWNNPEAIYVKSKEDLDKIMDIISNNGYTRTIG